MKMCIETKTKHGGSGKEYIILCPNQQQRRQTHSGNEDRVPRPWDGVCGRERDFRVLAIDTGFVIDPADGPVLWPTGPFASRVEVLVASGLRGSGVEVYHYVLHFHFYIFGWWGAVMWLLCQFLFEWREERELVPAPAAVVSPEIDHGFAFLNGRGLLDWINW